MSKYNIETLKRMNFNNTYALAVTHETAKYKLETVSDFAKLHPSEVGTLSLKS